MNQKIEPLTDDLAQHNEKQRDWVKTHFTENVDEKYFLLDEKLRLLDTIISQKWIAPTETWKLQALGITFGDALAQKLGMDWVTVTDEYGTDPALLYPRTTILVFPLTAVSKRVENRQSIDIFEMFDGFCEMILKQVEQNPRPN